MRDKLALYVCPRGPCAATALLPNRRCPHHRVPLVRYVYVRCEPPRGGDPSRENAGVRKMINALPGALRPSAERIAREAGYL